MREMHWRVICEDFNGLRIADYDIFEHGGFSEDVKKAYKKYRNDHDSFCESVRKSLAYYFWSKCEWEVIVSAWPPSDRVRERKVDVYEQVMLNWDVFIEYVWEQCRKRKQPCKSKTVWLTCKCGE